MRSILHKFDILILTRTMRWQFLVLTWLVVYLLYFVVLVESAVPDHCLTMSEVWLGNDSFVGPYFMFCIVFALMLAWAVVEHWLVWLSPKEDRKIGLIVTSVFIFLLASWCLGLSQHWIMLQIDQGKMTYDDYWLDMPIGSMKPGLEFTWSDFLQEKRCKDGVDIKNLSDKEWCELRAEFEQQDGALSIVTTMCAESPKIRLDPWKEEQDKFKAFMKEYKKALREEIGK